MLPVELEIKDMTESNTSATYKDLLLSVGKDGVLQHITKHDDFDCNMTNSPFVSCNIPFLPAYDVFSLSSYNMPGLFPHMNVYSNGNVTFQ